MKLSIQGIEIEVPSHAQVSVSEDGKRVSVEIPDSQITEKIRVVEVPSDRVVEKIRVVEVEKPCTRPHSDWHYYYPQTYPYMTVPSVITTTSPTWASGMQTESGGLMGGAQTVGVGTLTSCDNQMPDIFNGVNK